MCWCYHGKQFCTQSFTNYFANENHVNFPYQTQVWIGVAARNSSVTAHSLQKEEKTILWVCEVLTTIMSLHLCKEASGAYEPGQALPCQSLFSLSVYKYTMHEHACVCTYQGTPCSVLQQELHLRWPCMATEAPSLQEGCRTRTCPVSAAGLFRTSIFRTLDRGTVSGYD